MASFDIPHLYPSRTQIGKGTYKIVLSATNEKGVHGNIGIKSNVPPQNVAVAICQITENSPSKRLTDEILLQDVFSKKTPQLAPFIYGVVIHSPMDGINHYVGESLSTIKDRKDSNIGDTFLIYQQKCDSSLDNHIKASLEGIGGRAREYIDKDTQSLLEDTHSSIKELFNNIVDIGYINIDSKAGNICHFNGKDDTNGNIISEPSNIGLDVDPAFVIPFVKNIRESQITLERQDTLIEQFSTYAKIFMLIEYYLVFLVKYPQYITIVSQLLKNESIDNKTINDLLNFMSSMEKESNGNIFKYDIETFMPVFMIKHYLSYHLEKKEKDTLLLLRSMDIPTLSNKVCKYLGLPESAVSDKPGGSRKTRSKARLVLNRRVGFKKDLSRRALRRRRSRKVKSRKSI
jgi:hypothetical protein